MGVAVDGGGAEGVLGAVVIVGGGEVGGNSGGVGGSCG